MGSTIGASFAPTGRMRLGKLLLLLLVVSCKPAAGIASERICAVDGDMVVVDTSTHSLWLCCERRAIAKFRVALGRSGLEKTREGDGRTPLGTYALGEPRTSARFGLFIPIAYPTAEQQARGFTGTNVGIHGPDRRTSWLGGASTLVDWTAGCIATGTQTEISQVATFVRERRPRVLIRRG
jgi:murein L,D-transpeptidase YafK